MTARTIGRDLARESSCARLAVATALLIGCNLDSALVIPGSAGDLAMFSSLDERPASGPDLAGGRDLAPRHLTFSLAEAVTYPTARDATGVAIGDLNGDGTSDLAVTNGLGGSVNILLNQGRGTFAGSVDYAAGTYPNNLAIGDLDGDGKADLAISDFGNNVNVLFGTGGGKFAAALHNAAGTHPNSVALGDLDRDGRTDIVFVNGLAECVGLLLNHGNRLFAPVTTVSAGASGGGYSVSVGDLNGDGSPDVAATCGADLVVFLNAGNGSFPNANRYPLFHSQDRAAMGDLNGDGRPDLVDADGPGEQGVNVYLNNGDGTFAVPSPYASLGEQLRAIVIADLNGDGLADLVSGDDGGFLHALFNRGNGRFDTPLTFSMGMGCSVTSVAVGELNGDGLNDLAVACWPDGDVRVLLNTSH